MLVGFACSCAAAPAEQSTNQEVVHGDPDNADLNVVSLSGCTGTLIAPRIIMTAGHCIVSPALQSVYFGSDPVTDPGQRIMTVAQRVHPLFEPDGLINDIAVLVLAEDGPAEPIPLATEPFTDLQIGATLRLVGFGVNGNGPPGSKNQGVTIIDSYSDDKIAFHAHPAQTCVGDSGGPAFLTVKGVERVVGVTSSGDATCMTSAHDTRVDIFVTSFLEPYTAAIADGAAPLGHHCVGDANCATGMCSSSDDEPGFSYCSRACDTSADCPAVMSCDPVAGGKACHYAASQPGAAGSDCAVDFDCRTGLCGRSSGAASGHCTISCKDDLSCENGERCQALTSEVAPVFTGCAHPVDGGCAAGHGRSGLGGGLVVVFLVLRRRRALA